MDLLKLEQQRQALEANLQKLRQTLKHWQLWEAEYEGLKEELAESEDALDPVGLAKIAQGYCGDLLNEKEIRALASLDSDAPRSGPQIIQLIERRQEYVQKNIDTVQRQFFDAEAKQEELAFAAATQSGAADADLPLTEIHEELDEDDNVVSSRLSQPAEATAKAIQGLKEAGLTEDDLVDEGTPHSRPGSEELKPAIINANPTYSSSTIDKRMKSDSVPISPTGDSSYDEAERPAFRKKSVSFTVDTKEPLERPRSVSRDGKKSVSFNDKIAVMPAAPPPDTRSVSFSLAVEEIPGPIAGTSSPNVQPMALGEVGKARDLMTMEASDPTESDVPADEDVTLPQEESPEDARLRREMLDYHLNEVGNVVAQMDLDLDDQDYDDADDDAGSFHTTSEYPDDDDDDTPYTTGISESDESEDESGRSKHSQLTPEYRKQMEELQERLIGNLGPAPKDEDVVGDPDLNPKDVRRLVIRDKRNSTSSASSESSEKKSNTKKRVSFAEELDVAEPGSPPFKAQKHSDGENVTPLAETVSERKSAVSEASINHTSSDKPSRFKKTRAAAALESEAFTQPSLIPAVGSVNELLEDDRPLRTTLLERPVTKSSTASAPSLDDQDTVTQRRELAKAYYSRRNDFVRQQGGFKADADEDEEMGELMEEMEDGRLRKVSRFKAARIKGQ